jgi:hypothetical protein
MTIQLFTIKKAVMAELKTKPTKISVDYFINTIDDEQKRKDCFTIVKMMEKATKDKPKMWGTSIIGFCDVHLKYESGRELDWFKIGFSPRKANITLYLCGSIESQTPLLKKLGKHKTGKDCLYVNKLADVDVLVLKELIETGF